MGEVAQLDKETATFALGQRVVCMRGKVGVLDNAFLKFLLMSPTQQEVLTSYLTGTTVAGISQKALRLVPISIPPHRIQIAIGEILAALDDKIELNRRMNETLEAMARALFKDWFIDFGPTRAKQEGLEPYLAPELWSLFPERLDAEGKPEGWNYGRLKDCMFLQRGFDLPKTIRIPGAYQVIAASGPNGTHSEFKVKSPGVTTGRSGVLGNVFLLLDDFWPLNTSLWVKEFRLSSALHAYFLLQEMDLLALHAGSAVPTLNRNHVHQAVVVIPPKSLVRLFTESMMPMFERIRGNEQESRTLAQTRDLLLPKLMSGEIRIQDVERTAEAVL